jgi:hypothetical protein
MPQENISKAALLMLVLVSISIISWEVYLRKKGFAIAYDNSEALWADKRAMVYQPANTATVFIGSSRIKYDLDIPTWEAITSTSAIQLSCEGSNPNPILNNLANDINFKGNLIIDVTEGLFFSPPDGPNAQRSIKQIYYYKEITPAQKVSFIINHGLESQLVFLDKEHHSLSAMLDEIKLPNRKGVMVLPIFPEDFERVNFNRQSYMTNKMLADTNIKNRVTDIWMLYAKMGERFPPPSGDTLLHMIQTVKEATDKIKARGGNILFVRTPSSGPYWMVESKGFPKEKCWNKLLEITGCPGIHFMDYPSINHFVCPEWSHLAPKDAVTFTTELVKILKAEKGWKFSK